MCEVAFHVDAVGCVLDGGWGINHELLGLCGCVGKHFDQRVQHDVFELRAPHVSCWAHEVCNAVERV
eukprot:2007881-Rhodomonas_salina.1